MKILVTGGAGFIGSHIVDEFLEKGHEVVVIDNLTTGREENINPKARFLKKDIRDPDMMRVFERERFEVVNHQAALASVQASMEHPLEYADVNVRGGVNLLECSRKSGVKKFIYASTGGCVYGEPQYLPVDEKHPIAPRDPYGVSKANFELYLPAFAGNYGLAYTILRYPNIYGPRQDPLGEAGVVSIFTGQMLRGLQPVINGDGEQERDYVFVEDVARANLMALTQGDNDVFNLGWGIGTSVNKIFRTLKDITASDCKEVHGPAKPGEVRRSCLNAKKIKHALGWEPVVSLDEGLARTVDFFRPTFQSKS